MSGDFFKTIFKYYYIPILYLGCHFLGKKNINMFLFLILIIINYFFNEYV